MPPLNEGTLLYMPTAVPGMSITRSRRRFLQIQDRQLKRFRKSLTVFGKAGQAETATDPAPLSMFETVVALKPPDQWRARHDLGQAARGAERRISRRPAWRTFSGCRSKRAPKC